MSDVVDAARVPVFRRGIKFRFDTVRDSWVVLGPERLNPEYRPLAAEEKPVTERHPEVLWVAVIVVICGLGLVALRSARNLGR